jgi:hypothetical protein
LKSKVIQLEAELVHAKQAWHNIAGELEHEKDLTQRTIQSFSLPSASAAPSSSSQPQSLTQISAKDYGVIVSEMARYRGDASRLEVELITSNQRCDLLEIRIRELSNEVSLSLSFSPLLLSPLPLTLSALLWFGLQIDASLHRIQELEERNEGTEKSERAARKEASDLKIKYEGALIGSLPLLLLKSLPDLFPCLSLPFSMAQGLRQSS